MKYLKLFEDHKETSDKISEIEKLAQKQTEEAINQYKELIDEMMYDITDDYETESVINIKDIERSLDRHHKTYLDYRIHFTADQYEDLLDKLLEVVDRLKEAYDVSYNINGVYDVMTGNRLSGRISYYRNPFDFHEAKKIIKKFIDLNNLPIRRGKDWSRTTPEDIKLQLEISF